MLKEVIDNKIDMSQFFRGICSIIQALLDLMLFVRVDIPSKLLPNVNPSVDVEKIFVKLNVNSKKWLISGSYNPNVVLIQNHTVN